MSSSWRGAQPNAQAKRGETSLAYAVQAGDSAVVQRLLRSGADARLADRWQVTPLHHASRRGDKGLCELLLDAGAEVNAVDAWGGTALLAAAQSGRADAAELLLAKQALPFADRRGVSPLHAACKRGYFRLTQLLAKHGGKDAKARDGSTPLSLASSAVRPLLDVGPGAYPKRQTHGARLLMPVPALV